MKTVWVINGPNLNFLGIREPDIYGHESYEALVSSCLAWGKDLGLTVACHQKNGEGELIDLLQEAYREGVAGIVLNAGAYTHYSYALRDAISSIAIPTVEVHLSDVENREDFRRISVIRPVVVKEIHGKGFLGYREALEFLSRS